MYERIKIALKNEVLTYEHCDYYIQDNVLTVFRDESRWRNGLFCCKFHTNIPMGNVEYIECIEDKPPDNKPIN